MGLVTLIQAAGYFFKLNKNFVAGTSTLIVMIGLWFGIQTAREEAIKDFSTAARSIAFVLSALLPQTMLLADRGYDADWIRELARQQGAWANIPPKRNRKDPICFSPYLYRARNLVERFFNKIKQCRRVATRYDKFAANYLAFIKLASIGIWLRANESTP
jgi:transposase